MKREKNVGADSISARQRGITLIALVVTLVVLLILAGITISVVLSEGGIIAKANQAKEKQEIGQLKDQINLNVVDWYTDRILNDNVTIDNLWNKLIENKIIADAKTDVEGPDENGVYLITTNKGYVIEVIIDNKGNVTVGEGGKKDELPPRIVEFKSTSKTTSSIAVKAEVTRIEDGGKLSYYYKKSSETEYKALKENTTDKTADYTGLTQNEVYDLKLVATNKNGSVDKTISVLTGELASGTISQKGTTTWSAGTASVELQTTDTENTMQYQKNDITGTWTNYTRAITGLAYQDRIYARMFDGTNGNSPFSVDILDDIQPQTATINLSKTTTDTATAITGTVTQIDNESGVDVIKCKWVYNTTSGSIGTAESIYTGGTFSTNPQTISLNATIAGTYYLHVLTIDKEGNKKETISGAITVSQLATGITLNQTSATMYTGDTLKLTATVTPSNTANKNVTWISSNTTVATVSNGIVIARSAGSATITASTQDGSNKIATCSITVNANYVSQVKAGDWVSYTGGGYSGWRVLWEANNSAAGNGSSIQIISTGSTKNVTLGSTDLNTSKNSYNSAITTLNNEAMSYVNSTYASDARCVGSIPNNKSSESISYYTSSYSYMSPYNGQFKNQDENYGKDYSKMGTLGILDIGSNYWLASRGIDSNSVGTSIGIRGATNNSSTFYYNTLFYVNSSNSASGSINTQAFRPVVSLKSNIIITGGKGTQVSPWQLGI